MASKLTQKTSAIREWPTPNNASELKGFLGLVTLCRRFIPGFSAKAEPLNFDFSYNPKQEKAFSELKQYLVQPLVPAYPEFSASSGQFFLDTDASSGYGIGVVLSQQPVDGTERVNLLTIFVTICLGVSSWSEQTVPCLGVADVV